MSFIFVDFRRFFKLEPTTIRVFGIKIEDTEKTRGPMVNYQPYLDITRRAAYFAREAREVRKLEILSRFETNRPSERARRKGLSEAREGAKERRKNVEEVVTLAENCDCPVKLRVLYSLYFLPTVPPFFFLFFFSFPPLFSSHVGIYARNHCLITMLGLLHTSRRGYILGWAGCEEKRKPVRAIHTHDGPTTPLIQSEFTSIKLPPAPILITVRSN